MASTKVPDKVESALGKCLGVALEEIERFDQAERYLFYVAMADAMIKAAKLTIVGAKMMLAALVEGGESE